MVVKLCISFLYSFMPRTVAEWNHQPATISESPSVDTFKARLCSIKVSTHLKINKIA